MLHIRSITISLLCSQKGGVVSPTHWQRDTQEFFVYTKTTSLVTSSLPQAWSYSSVLSERGRLGMSHSWRGTLKSTSQQEPPGLSHHSLGPAESRRFTCSPGQRGEKKSPFCCPLHYVKNIRKKWKKKHKHTTLGGPCSFGWRWSFTWCAGHWVSWIFRYGSKTINLKTLNLCWFSPHYMGRGEGSAFPKCPKEDSVALAPCAMEQKVCRLSAVVCGGKTRNDRQKFNQRGSSSV